MLEIEHAPIEQAEPERLEDPAEVEPEPIEEPAEMRVIRATRR